MSRFYCNVWWILSGIVITSIWRKNRVPLIAFTLWFECNMLWFVWSFYGYAISGQDFQFDKAPGWAMPNCTTTKKTLKNLDFLTTFFTYTIYNIYNIIRIKIQYTIPSQKGKRGPGSATITSRNPSQTPRGRGNRKKKKKNKKKNKRKSNKCTKST